MQEMSSHMFNNQNQSSDLDICEFTRSLFVPLKTVFELF